MWALFAVIDSVSLIDLHVTFPAAWAMNMINLPAIVLSIAGRRRTLLLNVKPARMSVKMINLFRITYELRKNTYTRRHELELYPMLTARSTCRLTLRYHGSLPDVEGCAASEIGRLSQKYKQKRIQCYSNSRKRRILTHDLHLGDCFLVIILRFQCFRCDYLMLLRDLVWILPTLFLGHYRKSHEWQYFS